MKCLLVAATQREIEPLLIQLDIREGENELNGNSVFILITGVGMVATAFSLGMHLATKKYDLALNLGICGSFDRGFNLGDVVQIKEDSLAELGVEDGEEFISIDALGFGQSVFKPLEYKPSILLNSLKKAKSITVNKVHGNEFSISKTIDRQNPQVESMEGAAFFYSCNQVGLPCVQVRAISNYVERRNRQNWNIGLAVNNLNDFAVDFLQQLK